MSVIVFFAIAMLVAILFRVLGAIRLRTVVRRADARSGEVCQLQQANRISSRLGALAASGLLVGALAKAASVL